MRLQYKGILYNHVSGIALYQLRDDSGCVCAYLTVTVKSYASVLLLLALSQYGFAQFSDDFEDSGRIGLWQIYQSGDPDYYQSLMYGDSLLEGELLDSTEGVLVITCGPVYWYAAVTGPYVYQLTWGDFTATTTVHSRDRDDLTQPPDHEYNSTGLIVRNPDASSGQNYVMTNLGMQSAGNGIGSESKTTFNSTSILYLDPDEHQGQVRIVRTGTVIRTYKRTVSDTAFVLLDEFDRPDIPDTVQIGMVLNGYTPDPDIRGEFEEIRFHGGDCRVVRHGSDSGVSSLRAAVSCAAPGDTIRFDGVTLTDTIDLHSAPLFIDDDVVILNEGGNVVIRSSGLESLIEIAEGASVIIDGIDFVGTDTDLQQVILNEGALSLQNCRLTGHLPQESTIHNLGTLTLSGSCEFR